MSQLAEARAYFEKMPEEVVDAWFAESVQARGWPPNNPYWQGLFRGYTPEAWRAFAWSKEQVELSALPFTERSERIVVGLAAAAMAGVRNEFSGIENSASRMQSILKYILQTGNIPGFAILIHDPNGQWELIDGCHRVSCFVTCSKNQRASQVLSRLQWAWVARPPHEAIISAS